MKEEAPFGRILEDLQQVLSLFMERSYTYIIRVSILRIRKQPNISKSA